MITQRDRNYLLRVGSATGGYLEITGLHCTFSVRKSADNKKKGNHASVSIYNLSEDNRRALEVTGVTVALDVGYAETGLYELFSGDATFVETSRKGEDIVTTVTLDSAYTELNHKVISKLAPPGTTVKELIQRVAKELPGVSQTKFAGPNLDKRFLDGYPASGTPRQILTELCDAYGLEWQIDSGVLSVSDTTYSYMTNGQAFILNEASGLLERPEKEEIEKKRSKKDEKKRGRIGLKIVCLLNPLLKAGGTVKLEFGDLTGYYKIISVDHSGEIYGNSWETKLIVGSKEA